MQGLVEMVVPEQRATISEQTLRLALNALLHMELGVRPWAEMKDEEHARRVHKRIRDACDELTRALPK